MANLPSSKKRERQTKKRTRRNLSWKKAITELAKKIRRLERGEKLEEKPEEFMKGAQEILDKAAKRGIIHRNKASRLKSRWSKKLKS